MSILRWGIVLVAWCGLGLPAAGLSAQDETPEAALQRFNEAYAGLDADKDGQLTLAEFLHGRKDVPVATRDYHMADADDNQQLTLTEFLTIPVVVSTPLRGPLPDIILGLVEQILVTLDKACEDWDKEPDRELDSRQFVTAIASQLGGSAVMRLNIREVDPDLNNKVTRAEARRFVEIQMGVRRSDGALLRLPNGRVVNYMLFLHADENRDDKLDRREFVERTYGGADVAEEFVQADRDQNSFVSFDEWAQMTGRAVRDPVLEFRGFDVNLDARVDRDELVNGTDEWQQPLVRHVFPAFDWNQDGVLSLAEYRTTPVANSIISWQNPLTDTNGDDVLTLNEFQFDNNRLFPFLRMLYFQRLDTNHDTKLDPQEWDFKVRTPDEFFVMNENGTGWKPFFRFGGYNACGSPAVSPDGKFLAFDGWSTTNGTPHIFVMPIAGGVPQTVGTGSMPSWAPDGERLVCSHGGSPMGVRLYTRQPAQWTASDLVEGGWGAQFSPDGKQIAFTAGAALKLYDVEAKTIKDVIAADVSPYQQIFWNLSWSPAGSHLCFKGMTAGGSQDVATFDITKEKPPIKVRHTGKHAVNADFAWHPTKNRVIFSMFCAERRFTQLYEFDPTNDDPPKLVDGQDPARNNTDACWTPDGKKLIVISGDF